MTDVEGLLRELRAEIRADIQQIRADMTAAWDRVEGRTVDRDTHAAQMGALEHRVTALESRAEQQRMGVVYPLLVGLLLAAVGVLATIALGGG